MAQLLVDPRPAPGKPALTLASRPPALAGRSLGLLSNGKPNADAFLETVAALLVERAAVGRIGRHRKATWSRRAPDDVIRQLAQYDAVIAAVGD